MSEQMLKAWDNKNKVWLDNTFNVSSYGNVFLLEWGEEVWIDATICRSTGLKDKNGVMIFEGDIIVMDCYPFYNKEKLNYISTVEFIYCQWQTVMHCINKDLSGISDGINSGLNDDGFEENENSQWKIIGNIFEHKHLLEEKLG